jgi:hypothetical protein
VVVVMVVMVLIVITRYLKQEAQILEVVVAEVVVEVEDIKYNL